MSRLSQSKPPVTPGEILVGEFLEPLGIKQHEFAKAIGVSPSYISDIVRGRRGVSPEMALRFETALKMPARFWLNAQQACDLYAAEHDEGAAAKRRKIKIVNRTPAA
jgi:addiction module HigA family antidote